MLENQMQARGLLNEDQIKQLRAQCQNVMAQAVAELTEPADKGKRRIRPELWPSRRFC